MTIQESDGARAVGLGLIRDSSLTQGSKYQYTCAWNWWVSFFEDEGVDPLTVSVDDALRWLESDYSEPASRIKKVRRVVAFVYQTLGVPSPMAASRVLKSIGDGTLGYKPDTDLHEKVLEIYERRVKDYIGWCNCNGVPALPGSPQQTADFLWSICDEYEPQSISMASAAVARYLEFHGFPGTGREPVVLSVLAECRARIGPRERKVSAVEAAPPGNHAQRYHRHWIKWCEAQPIEWQDASVEDALRYLREIEHQKDASLRVAPLSRLYPSAPDPFCSDEVLAWKKWHLHANKTGTLPVSSVGSRTVEFLAELRAVRSKFEGPLPDGLTQEQVDAVSDDLDGRYSDGTLRNYAESWVRFNDWLDLQGVAMPRVEDMHVAVYLQERAETCRVSTVAGDLAGISAIFDELRYESNPALSVRVTNAMLKLQAERREVAAQVPAFRRKHFNAVVAYASRLMSGENSDKDRLKGALILALFSLMFDAMLRRGEAAAVRWSDLKMGSGGSGALAVPFTKTTRFGDGPPTYVSPETMERLYRYRELRRELRCELPRDARIFQRSAETVGHWIKEACESAGLEDGFTTHSLRIGMACELAVAGFGLPLIMLAGRWEKPDMVVYYIRNLRLDDTAVAELRRMRADGRARASHEMRGGDVLSTYHHLQKTLY